MDDLDQVRQRAATDAAFRAALERDPQSALAGYDLMPASVAAVEGMLRDDDVRGFAQLFDPDGGQQQEQERGRERAPGTAPREGQSPREK